jgi:colanic acid biosynthesis glycosyl transferase WcaI
MTHRPTRSAIFLHRFYWPDVAAAGQMLTDLAESLAGRGWEVTVVTSQTAYERGMGGELPRMEVHRGVRIVRVRAIGLGRNRLLARVGDQGVYLVGALWRVLRLPRADMIVSMSEPPFLLAVGALAARLRGAKLVYWVQDLYPNLLGSLGLVPRQGIVYRAMARAARFLHRRCDAVITLGPQMARKLVEAGADPARVAYVHNWADAHSVRPIPAEENSFLRDSGLSGKFVVLYSGNAGRAHTFRSVIGAMRRLCEHEDIVFVFIGGGKRLGEIRAAAEEAALPNVRFFGYVPRAELAHSLSAASVSLVTEHPEVVGLLVPSKTYGIMASGRPLIFVGSPESDVAAIVRANGCGEIVSPDDEDALVEAILRLRDRPELRAAMGNRGRYAAEVEYTRERATAEWAAAVDALIGERAGGIPSADSLSEPTTADPTDRHRPRRSVGGS